MKRFLLLTAIAICFCLCLTGCGRYSSHYIATALIQSNDSNSAFMDFYHFKGTIVFKLKIDKHSTGTINYSAKLSSGSITVYYDSDGTKKEWFSLHNGESVESSLEGLNKGKVYIIIESDGQCENGELNFKVK